MKVAPMKVWRSWSTLEGNVLLADALRFAEERVAEALQLQREYGDGLAAELANDYHLQHHPASGSPRAPRTAGPSGDERAEGVRSCGTTGPRRPSALVAAPAGTPDVDGPNDPGDEIQTC